jgi:predicted ATP-grasp superfamily ATP-dependent carboligase
VQTILVTDGEQRAALALVRAYGRAGHRVYVCASGRGKTLAGASRFCAAEAAVRDALGDADGFVGDVRALIERWGVTVLVPVTDASLGAVLPRRDRLPDVVLPFPDAAVYERASDKALVLDLAREIGIAVPAEQRVASPADAETIAGTLDYPVVIKPSRSVTSSENGRLKLGVTYASSGTELRARLHELDRAAYPVLLQERVAGDGVGVFVLLWEGQCRAVFSHRRLREKPPSGGVSVYCESIAPDPVLVERSLALLQRLGWNGVAMIEYKVDRSDGRAYLMEINGRFWGSLQLAIDAGVDFPNLLLAAATGSSSPPLHDYRVGVRCRWWWGDVDHLLLRLRRSAAQLALPPHAPSRLRVLRDFLNLAKRGDRNEVLRLDDPAPFVRETVDWFRRR